MNIMTQKSTKNICVGAFPLLLWASIQYFIFVFIHVPNGGQSIWCFAMLIAVPKTLPKSFIFSQKIIPKMSRVNWGEKFTGADAPNLWSPHCPPWRAWNWKTVTRKITLFMIHFNLIGQVNKENRKYWTVLSLISFKGVQ